MNNKTKRGSLALPLENLTIGEYHIRDGDSIFLGRKVVIGGCNDSLLSNKERLIHFHITSDGHKKRVIK